MLTISEAANFMHVSPATVKRMVDRGLVPHYVLPTTGTKRKTIRLKQEDLEMALEDYREEPRPLSLGQFRCLKLSS